MKDTNTVLAEMPIGKAFARLAAPAIAAQLINITYNIVDKMYIGHIPDAGANALAGVGVTAPVIFAISTFAALVSMGGAPKASIYMGEGNTEAAEKVMGSCTWLLVVLSILLTAVMLVFGEPICRVFGASDATITYSVQFLNVYSLGTLFTQLTLGLNTFISAQGKTLFSMVTVAIGAVLNIIFDGLFVLVFSMGVTGSALGTVIAQGISAVVVVVFLSSSKTKLRLRRENVKYDKKILLPCVLLGTSPALMQLTENLVAISFNTSLQHHGGDVAVASMSILTTIMQFTMLLLPALYQGAQALLSYNFGANNIPRVKDTFRILLKSCVAGSFMIWAFCVSVPDVVAGIFTNDAELISYTVVSMRCYLAMLFIYGVQVACQFTFVALDQPKRAIFLTLWRKVVLLIPLIFILPNVFPDAALGVFLAEPIADTIAVCTTAPMFYYYYRKL